MSVPAQPRKQVEMIPIEQIDILNPRSRNRRVHREIVESIKAVGLKRPITVSRRLQPDGSVRYALACGQGRIEAFQQLNQSEIPAFVTDASEEDCLVMSLVENIARRQHRPIEIMREVGNIRARGQTDAQIAERIGVSTQWVNMIGGLIDKGEERLLTAVETGVIPLSLATLIARSSEAETQELLSDAYEKGLRGKKLTTVRRLLERRAKHDKGLRLETVGSSKTKRKKLTVADLRRMYEQEAESQRLKVKTAAFTHNRLVFITEAFKDLLSKPDFVALLHQEKLDTMPAVLRDRIGSAGARA